MSAVSKREYKGESELEYYSFLSPDDGSELDDEYCEGCGHIEVELFETDTGIPLCKSCYDADVEEEEECEN